jgi:hypothetical protein
LNKIVKIKKLFYFWAAASLACMAAIFWFSSQTGENSGEMSSALTNILFGFAQDWDTGGDTANIMDTLGALVRKSAHFVIYFVLGFCTANTMRQLTDNKKYIFWIASGWSSFYAATDELHQYFVPGRSCMWQDWALDTAGVLCGIGAAFFAVWIVEKITNRRFS